MFPLCRGQFIFGHYGPAVFFVDKHVAVAHVNHGFDGKYHAGNEEHAVMTGVIMIHFGFFVKLQSDSVSAEFAYDGKTVFACVLLDGLADIADKTPGFGCFGTNLQTFLGYAHELFFFGSGLADDKHTRGIAVITVENGADVYIDDVAFLQYFIF